MKTLSLAALLAIASLTAAAPARAWTVDGAIDVSSIFAPPAVAENGDPDTTGSIGRGRRRAAQSGDASWYGPGFQGRRTANGEKFNTHAYTAAHRRLPFGTRVRVTNTRNGRSVVVRINDRGPFAHGRIIDLSQAAARAVGITGVGRVHLTQI